MPRMRIVDELRHAGREVRQHLVVLRLGDLAVGERLVEGRRRVSRQRVDDGLRLTAGELRDGLAVLQVLEQRLRFDAKDPGDRLQLVSAECPDLGRILAPLVLRLGGEQFVERRTGLFGQLLCLRVRDLPGFEGVLDAGIDVGEDERLDSLRILAVGGEDVVDALAVLETVLEDVLREARLLDDVGHQVPEDAGLFLGGLLDGDGGGVVAVRALLSVGDTTAENAKGQRSGDAHRRELAADESGEHAVRDLLRMTGATNAGCRAGQFAFPHPSHGAGPPAGDGQRAPLRFLAGYGRLPVPLDPAAAKEQQITAPDRNARGRPGHLVVNSQGAEREAPILEVPAKAAGGDSRAGAKGDQRNHRTGWRLDDGFALDERYLELIVMDGEPNSAAKDHEHREIREGVVRAPAAGADHVDVGRAALNREGNRLFEVRGIGRAHVVKTIGGNDATRGIAGRIEVPDNGVDGEAQGQRFVDPSVGGDDEIGAASEIPGKGCGGWITVCDNEGAHRPSKRDCSGWRQCGTSAFSRSYLCIPCGPW